ncbi:hypothetical protein [Rahnella victoriana]|uniref:Uncharacterized protein n=1 Tax=Rahnella victoriana TaxID=1510570 RepID=A0ABS0DQH9_9GAMM|nr:hypothetical protein [Rahnella victoriana]MBF7956149.1 hypothetical protein [Rahnella victoriana]
MMKIDDIRYRFECHMDKFYPELDLGMKGDMLTIMSPSGRNDIEIEYSTPAVQLMWKMFYSGAESERKSMTVSLPAMRSKPEGYYDAGYNEGIQDSRKTLIAAGVKVREN